MTRIRSQGATPSIRRGAGHHGPGGPNSAAGGDRRSAPLRLSLPPSQRIGPVRLPPSGFLRLVAVWMAGVAIVLAAALAVRFSGGG